jgi:hypothetical protein
LGMRNETTRSPAAAPEVDLRSALPIGSSKV